MSMKRAGRKHWPVSEVGGMPHEVRTAKHSGLDLLTLSSSHFDPNRTLGRGWASQLDWIKAVIYRR